MVSKVVQVGEKVQGIQKGMIVYPYPRRAGTVGGFSEYVLIPNAELNRQVYEVPSGIAPRVACLIEPFTVGFCAAQRSEPKARENAIAFLFVQIQFPKRKIFPVKSEKKRLSEKLEFDRILLKSCSQSKSGEGAMPSLTRTAIIHAFLQLLEERPLSNITVKDVVDTCGINRNTFYYYFEDIPTLIEAISKDEVDRLIQAHARVD